jgi:hypothetical protein
MTKCDNFYIMYKFDQTRSYFANEKEVRQSEKPNIISPLLHNVKGDGPSQSVTTSTSCKSVTRQI